MIKILIAIVSVIAVAGILGLIRRIDKITPDTMITHVRKHGKRWETHSGCLRDAQTEGWLWGATKRGEIIDVSTGKRTGRVLRQITKRK